MKIIELMITCDWNQGLYHACEGGYLYIIDLMIKLGANHFDSGLLGACNGGHLDIVNLMIEKGTNNLDDCLCNVCE